MKGMSTARMYKHVIRNCKYSNSGYNSTSQKPLNERNEVDVCLSSGFWKLVSKLFGFMGLLCLFDPEGAITGGLFIIIALVIYDTKCNNPK